MLRPSLKRRISPRAMARLGGSFQPSMKIMPLTRWTRRSPATPVPYSFQQRQRAKYLGEASGSQGRLVASPCHVSQSKLARERPGGGGYSHAPLGSLRPSEPSTRVRVPTMPLARSSLALAQRTELTRCEPICTTRPDFLADNFLGERVAAVVEIASGDTFDAGELDGVAEKAVALHADADNAEAEAVAGRG